MDDFELFIIDSPHQEELAVDIYYKNMQWAQLDQAMKLEVYPHPEDGYWTFSLDQVMDILKLAKLELFKCSH